MADKIVKITFRLPEDDHALLTEVKDSGNVRGDSFAPLIRLYVRMGLLLHRHGIQSIEDLNKKLARLNPEEVSHLEDRILERLGPQMREAIRQELERRDSEHN